MVICRGWVPCRWGREFYSYNYSQTAVFTIGGSYFRFAEPLVFQS
jgi:hypothetical protein